MGSFNSLIGLSTIEVPHSGVVIIGGMANNLISYTSDQTVIQRYLTTKDEKSAKHSILLNGVMSVFVSVAFFAIGAGLYTFFKTHPADMDYTMAKNDIIFPFFMMSQLPAGLAGLLIAAIFAATMSTISSNINSVATAFTVDFYQRFDKKSFRSQYITDSSLLKSYIWRFWHVYCTANGYMGYPFPTRLLPRNPWFALFWTRRSVPNGHFLPQNWC